MTFMPTITLFFSMLNAKEGIMKCIAAWVFVVIFFIISMADAGEAYQVTEHVLKANDNSITARGIEK
jgi:hypothetical protein